MNSPKVELVETLESDSGRYLYCRTEHYSYSLHCIARMATGLRCYGITVFAYCRQGGIGERRSFKAFSHLHVIGQTHDVVCQVINIYP